MNCRHCGKPLTFIPEYQKFYCYKCEVYPSIEQCKSCRNSLVYYKEYNKNYCPQCQIYLPIDNSETKFDLINKFLISKNDKEKKAILYKFNSLRWVDKSLLEQQNIDSWEWCIQAHIENLKINGNMSSEERDITLNNRADLEYCLSIIPDLKKLFLLFTKRGISIDYFEIVAIMIIILKKEDRESSKKMVLPFYNALKKKMKNNIHINAIIDEFFKLPGVQISCNDVYFSTLILPYVIYEFGLPYNEESLRILIEKKYEEFDLIRFEKDLGKRKNTLKINTINLDGLGFEDFLVDLFSSMDYLVLKTPITGDQGADLILKGKNETVIVQAKRYENKVTNKAVQEIVAAKKYYNADRCMVITNSMFTRSAFDLAKANDVELWDGEKLDNVIAQYIGNKEIDIFNYHIECFFDKNKVMKKKKISRKLKVICPLCGQDLDCSIDFQLDDTKFKQSLKNKDMELITDYQEKFKCGNCQLEMYLDANLTESQIEKQKSLPPPPTD